MAVAQAVAMKAKKDQGLKAVTPRQSRTPRADGKPEGLIFCDGLIGEGASRRAYSCRASGRVGGWEAYGRWGSGLVIKTMKPEFKEMGVRVTQADVDMQNEASRLVHKFSSTVKPQKDGVPCPVYMRQAELLTFKAGLKSTETGISVCNPGESVLLEAKVAGKYEKFNSNSGWSGGFNLPDAFSHWTWVESGGALLVCDLQGQRGCPGAHRMAGNTDKYWYMFTDPAVCSQSKRYGITDLGQKGIQNWFLKHKCNTMCESLGLNEKRPSGISHYACKRVSTYR